MQGLGSVKFQKPIFDCEDSCNKCGGKNTVKPCVLGDAMEVGGAWVEESLTKCQDCGFEDCWGYGYFDSRQQGYNACAKYSFDKEVTNV